MMMNALAVINSYVICIIELCIVIYALCKKIYDDCGGFVLVGFIIAIPISIIIGKLILPYLL